MLLHGYLNPIIGMLLNTIQRYYQNFTISRSIFSFVIQTENIRRLMVTVGKVDQKSRLMVTVRKVGQKKCKILEYLLQVYVIEVHRV